MILHDIECMAHGFIRDAPGGRCPSGCSKDFTKIVFTKAPAIKSGKTKYIDREARALADSFGMTNIPTVRGPESVKQAEGRTRITDLHPHWLEDIPHNNPGWSWDAAIDPSGRVIPKTKEEAAKFDVGSLGTTHAKGAPAGFQPEPYQEVLAPPKPLIVGRPRERLPGE